MKSLARALDVQVTLVRSVNLVWLTTGGTGYLSGYETTMVTAFEIMLRH